MMAPIRSHNFPTQNGRHRAGGLRLEGCRARPLRQRAERMGRSCPTLREAVVSCAEIVLKFGIEPDVALIVTEQIELDLVVAWPGEERRVERPSVR